MRDVGWSHFRYQEQAASDPWLEKISGHHTGTRVKRLNSELGDLISFGEKDRSKITWGT